jgi:23S rRNA (uridine2479-2'-O)-methyltransferase
VTRGDLRVTTRNARFQQWQALLDNRTKRTRSGEFVVQGVRPITQAVRLGWDVRALLYAAGRPLSAWASGLLDDVGRDTERVAMAPDLLAELGDRAEDAAPELVAVVAQRPDDPARVEVGPGFLGVVLDRPTNPGNVGTIVRSADAFGAGCVIVVGHGADPYDPRAVRASTGSLFALPVVRVPSAAMVLDWLAGRAAVVGTDETGAVDAAGHDLTGPTLLVVGNETTGMSAAWRDACDVVVRIPIGGTASSLNASSAASVVLYEAVRQRER